MEETSEPNIDYSNGFNQGYLLAKYMPDLLNKLQDKHIDSDRGRGLINGQKQYLFESKESRMPSWLKADRHLSGSKNPEKDKGKDSIDRT